MRFPWRNLTIACDILQIGICIATAIVGYYFVFDGSENSFGFIKSLKVPMATSLILLVSPLLSLALLYMYRRNEKQNNGLGDHIKVALDMFLVCCWILGVIFFRSMPSSLKQCYGRTHEPAPKEDELFSSLGVKCYAHTESGLQREYPLTVAILALTCTQTLFLIASLAFTSAGATVVEKMIPCPLLSGTTTIQKRA